MRQAPFRAILFGRHVVGGPQVTLQHLQLAAIFEADDVVIRDRTLRVDCGLLLDLGLGCRLIELGKRREYCLDQPLQLVQGDRIVRHMRRDDVGGELEKLSMVDWLCWYSCFLPSTPSELRLCS